MLRIVQNHLTTEYLEKYGIGSTFIETGTYMGDTIQMLLDWKESPYKTIHSIEYDRELFAAAVKEFQNNLDVNLRCGDSPQQLKIIHESWPVGPATYWLDAHASGPLSGGDSVGTPVLDELREILRHAEAAGSRESTIFIDDRRLFGSAEWGFVQESFALELIRTINPDYKILYLDGHIPGDVICATVR